jgi:hypothetical protein
MGNVPSYDSALSCQGLARGSAVQGLGHTLSQLLPSPRRQQK